MIKFQLSNENWNFEKSVSITMSLAASQRLKDFSDEISYINQKILSTA